LSITYLIVSYHYLPFGIQISPYALNGNVIVLPGLALVMALDRVAYCIHAFLFNVYIADLLSRIISSDMGCNVGGNMINVLV